MGRGGTTKQTGVTRHTPSYSSDAAAVGSGSGPAPDMASSCLIGFTEEMLLDGPNAAGARVGITITLVPGIPGTISMMSGGARIGSYDGDYKSLILRCMRKKYVYRGEIESVRTTNGKLYAVCNMQGLGLV